MTTLLGLLGIGSLCGRIPLSALADRCGRYHVYVGVLCVYGTATACLCLASSRMSLAAWAAYAALCGACCGTLMALTGPVAGEMVLATAPQLLPVASTAGFTAMGMGVTFGPPLAGLMYDMRGDYFLSFGFAAGALWLGAIVLIVPPLAAHCGFWVTPTGPSSDGVTTVERESHEEMPPGQA